MRLFDILGQMADGLKGICKDHGHPRGSLLTFDVTRDVVTHVYTGIVGTDCALAGAAPKAVGYTGRGRDRRGAGLRSINATTVRSYDTRSDDRLDGAKAAGMRQAAASNCIQVESMPQYIAAP